MGTTGAAGWPRSSTSALAARLVLLPVPFAPTRDGAAIDEPWAALHALRTELPVAGLSEGADFLEWDAAARRLVAEAASAPGVVARATASARLETLYERVHVAVREVCQTFLSHGKPVGVVCADPVVASGALEAHARRHAGLGLVRVEPAARETSRYLAHTLAHVAGVTQIVSVQGDVDGPACAADLARVLRVSPEVAPEDAMAPLAADVYLSACVEDEAGAELALALARAAAGSGRHVVGFDVTTAGHAARAARLLEGLCAIVLEPGGTGR